MRRLDPPVLYLLACNDVCDITSGEKLRFASVSHNSASHELDQLTRLKLLVFQEKVSFLSMFFHFSSQSALANACLLC